MIRTQKNQYLWTKAIVPFLFAPMLAHASAFQVFEQGTNSLGYAHADMASLADDASTVFFNPAGMTRFKKPQAISGGTFAEVRIQFDGWIAYVPSIGDPLGRITNFFTTFAYSQFIGLISGEAAPWAYISDFSDPIFGPTVTPINNPTFKVPRAKGDTHPVTPFIHFVTPVYCSKEMTLSAGFSIAAPFGLESDYSGTYVQPYAADSKFEQISLNGAVAARYKKVSLGFGLDYMFLKDFYSIRSFDTGASVYLSNVDPTLHRIDLSLKSRIWNWNIGLLYEYSEHFRLGATYRARSDFRQNGDFNALAQTGKNRAIFHCPDYLNVGCYGDISAAVGLMLDFGVTFWSRFDEVTLETNIPFVLIPGLSSNFQIATQNIKNEFHYNNSYFLALGTKYTVDDDLIFKFGLSYETSPTLTRYRELRIPDHTRYSISTGFHYDVNSHLGLDVAYQFTFIPKTNISMNPFLSPDVLINSNGQMGPRTTLLPHGGAEYNGTVKTQAQIFSMQLSWTF